MNLKSENCRDDLRWFLRCCRVCDLTSVQVSTWKRHLMHSLHAKERPRIHRSLRQSSLAYKQLFAKLMETPLVSIKNIGHIRICRKTLPQCDSARTIMTISTRICKIDVHHNKAHCPQLGKYQLLRGQPTIFVWAIVPIEELWQSQTHLNLHVRASATPAQPPRCHLQCCGESALWLA